MNSLISRICRGECISRTARNMLDETTHLDLDGELAKAELRDMLSQPVEGAPELRPRQAGLTHLARSQSVSQPARATHAKRGGHLESICYLRRPKQRHNHPRITCASKSARTRNAGRGR